MSVLGLFGKSAANEAADRILAAVAQAARAPDLYGEGRAPDTLDGRFEMLTAFATVALLRLKASPEADKVAQIFTDRLFRFLDAGLREAGVGDLTVPKRMRVLAERFYGRLSAYAAAGGAPAALAAALSRNVWNEESAPFADALAARLVLLQARFADAPPQSLESATAWAVAT